MPPSASKQKRLAEKAAKQAAKSNTFSVTSSTPPGSTNGGSSINTPLTSLSAATSQEDLTSMAKLQIATERSALSILRFIVPLKFGHFQGAQQVCSYLTLRGEISRSMPIRCLFMADCLSRVPRLPLTTARDMVFLGIMVQGRCVLDPIFSTMPSHPLPVDIPAIYRFTRHISPASYRHLSCPWRG